MHRRCLAPVLALGSVLATATATATAMAQDGALEVAIHREAPFDQWCVKPLCKGRSNQRAPLMKVPATMAANGAGGLLELRLKRSLSDALEGAAKAMLGAAYNSAIADLADALAATATGDQARLDDLGGLGASVERAALAYQLDGVVPPDPACSGPRRIDAIYEGLATSVALAPLDFPHKKGRAATGCSETAKKTASAIDAAVLSTIVGDQAKRDADAAAKAVADVKKACDGVSAATVVMRATTVAETQGALRAVKSAPPPPAADPGAPPSANEQACAQAMSAISSIDPASLDALAKEGLADASLEGIVVPLRATADRALALVTRIATGATNGDDMRALVATLVRAIAQSAGLPVDAPVLKDAIAALPQAVVVHDGEATVDPNAILAFLASQYDVGEDGKPSLRSLVGLGPTPWVFELNGALPVLHSSNDWSIVGDAKIGYATPKVGVIASGGVNGWNEVTSTQSADSLHAYGGLEAWWLSGDAASKLRFELRVRGGGDWFDSTTVRIPPPAGGTIFIDYNSAVGRGAMLAGIRYGAPVDRFSLQLLAGGGAQYENPENTTFKGTQLSDVQHDNWTVHGTGRIALRWRMVPQVLGLRVRGDATYSSITRSEFVVSFGGITSSATERQDLLEAHGRLFVDADVASLGGFVPSLFGGADVIGFSGSTTSSTTFVPLVGVGIVRHSY